MARTSKKQVQNDRIFLFNNWNRKKDIEKVLDNVVSIANNTVIPICNALEMTVLKPEVLKWVDDEESFREAFVRKCKREAVEFSGYIGKMVESSANDDFDNQLRLHPYPVYRGTTNLSDEVAKLVKITSRGVMTWDDEKLTEYTNVYLTDPKQIEAYRRTEELCKVLNEFFSGTKLAPSRNERSAWATVLYVTPDGSFNVNPRADFIKLIKKQGYDRE